MQCCLDHIALNVEDDEKMLAFYTGVLHLAPERVREYHNGTVPFPSVRLNADTIIDLFPERMWRSNVAPDQGRERWHHFCLSMGKEAWHLLLQRLRANAIAIEQGPVARWGAHGIGTSFYFRDPEGNLIEARYYEHPAASPECPLGS